MTNASQAFEGLLDRYFEGRLADDPTGATFAGLKAGEGKLPRATVGAEKKRERLRQAAIRELDRLNPRELSSEQHLDRLALRSLLLRESEDHARGRAALEPNAPEQLFNILLHELQRSEDAPRRAAANLRSLLAAAPRYLEEAGGVVRQPERVWLRVMQQAVQGADTLLEGVENVLRRVEAQAADAGAVASTRRALHRYRDELGGRRPAPRNSFAIGPAALQRRVRDELGLDYTLSQVEALALGEAERLNARLRRACAPFGRNRRPEQIIAAARAEWRPAKPLLALYQEETRRVAAAFRAARAVTFPSGDELQVRPVPDFLRALIPTAAYSAPGAFERRQRGIFWVNDLSVTKQDPGEKLAEQQQHFGLALTCAHEAYPGHHLQFVTANRHPRRWRRLFAHAVFYEGWTLWCEQMSADLKVDSSPWLEVQQLHDALWRCHRILVDLRLQSGRYTYAQAVGHLEAELGFTQARAEADVNWYTAQPAVPMSYWLGRLENERLRQRLMLGRGWSLRRFNDWLLSFGTLPQSWIEKYGSD